MIEKIFCICVIIYLAGFLISLVLPSFVNKDEWSDDVHTISGRFSFAYMWPVFLFSYLVSEYY